MADRSLGTQLRILRRRRGLTQDVLAHRIGRSERWLRAVERGSVDLWVSDALQLAEVLGVSITELIATDGGRASVAGSMQIQDRPASRPPWDTRTFSEQAGLDPERLLTALYGVSRIDMRLVESMSMVTNQLTPQWGSLRHEALRQLVHTHLLALRVLLDERIPSNLRRPLESAAAETATFAGQLAIFVGEPQHAESYLQLAASLAVDAGDAETHALALMFSSHLHFNAFLGGHGDRPQQARRLLEEATHRLSPTIGSMARTWVLVCDAEMQAGAGDELRAHRFMDDASASYSTGTVPSDGLCCRWGTHILAAYRGHIATVLGCSAEAVRLLNGVLATLRPGALMIRSAALADLAIAHLRRGDLDESCAQLRRGLALARQNGLSGAAARIMRIRNRDLMLHAREPEVRRFDEEIRADM